jgi:hypothetical protein
VRITNARCRHVSCSVIYVKLVLPLITCQPSASRYSARSSMLPPSITRRAGVNAQRAPVMDRAIEIASASGNQGNSLRPLGARTFSKGICSQKSGVPPDANFAFSPYMRTLKNIKRSSHGSAAFSLVEVTLAPSLRAGARPITRLGWTTARRADHHSHPRFAGCSAVSFFDCSAKKLEPRRYFSGELCDENRWKNVEARVPNVEGMTK